MKKTKVVFYFCIICLLFSISGFYAFGALMNGEDDGDRPPDLHIITNYIFWCSYTYDRNRVKESIPNGLQGMSDHGFSHVLANGDYISIYAGYLTDDNAKENFQASVSQCKKIQGIGVFKQLYECENEIRGCVVRTMPSNSAVEYLLTYRKHDNTNIWEWDALKLILNTFRFIDGDEFIGLYQALYPDISVEKYKNDKHPSKLEVW